MTFPAVLGVLKRRGSSSLPAALVLHFDGSNGATTTLDSSGNGVVVTAINGATISTAQSKFGGSSAKSSTSNNSRWETDDTGIRLVGQFTVQFWLYMPSVASNKYPVATKNVSGTRFVWFYTQTSGMLNCYCLGNDITASGGAISANTWHHIAISRDASNVRYLFIDGVLIGSSVLSANQSVDTGWTFCGASPSIVGSANVECYVDDAVIVLGSCLYTSGFTPPTAPW